ncbi:TPA: helix-turn-helix domain-containing protein [Candidatus Galligastranaerophilus intestinavium]|uniref:Helix-turn-helix domain-containing protein n=1 Tax=Candidatus Galligastranaerophilus intestinavium TaxID=2840836 RepID=A0A9D1FK55_9BACT|nr:helix-turn-helix domain-containing protein [Candidatus Galligastranaerophilus intestinavium]
MIAEDKKFIGQKIKQQRKRLKLTQFELAEKVGIHEKQLSRIEAGLHYPSLENFIKILRILNISLSEFEEKKEINPIKDDICQLLDESDNYELKIYRDVIKTLKKNL